MKDENFHIFGTQLPQAAVKGARIPFCKRGAECRKLHYGWEAITESGQELIISGNQDCCIR